jgi:ABC-2 type transport system ATP-binding protein
MSPPTAISTDDLRKSFASKKGTVEAVLGISIDVARAEIFGLLGPNGAGKTTMLRMLTTLLPIDAGSARVAGFDVATAAQRVREHIGYVSQLGGAAELATGRENLVLQGRLYGASLAELRPRVDELASVLDLAEFADRRVKTYSGGQRRRLDVALGIVHQPNVLFLDEPSTRRTGRTCGTTCGRCATAARRSCSPRTTSRKRTRSATASSSSTMARSWPTAPRAS